MALTKVSRGLLSTSIVDNGTATAITIDSSENVSFTGAATFSGDVGIGGSPSRPLHVYGPDGAGEGTPTFNANTVAVFQNNGTSADGTILNIVSGSASTGFIAFGNSTDDIRQAIVANMSDDSLELRTGNNITALTINASGNLGIGTSSPANMLHLSNTSEGTHDLAFTRNTTYGTSTGLGGISWYNQAGDTKLTRIDSQTDGSATNTRLIFSTASSGTLTERMRIDASGNLTLNTANSTLNVGNGGFSQTNYGLLGLNGSNGGFIKMGTAGVEQGAVYANSGGLTFQTPATYAMTWYPAGAFGMKLDTSGDLLVGTTATINGAKLNVNGNAVTYVIHPAVDNLFDVGHPSYRWDDIRATNGTIQTSDRNDKQDIEELNAAEIAVAVTCKGLMRKFRWKDAVTKKGDDARTHFGIIAQDLQAAFEAEGLDAGDYAMFISDTWWETQTEVEAVEAVEFVQAVEAVYDENGEIVSEAVEGVEAVEAKDAYTRTDTFQTLADAPEGATERTRLGVRYSELLAFIIAAI